MEFNTIPFRNAEDLASPTPSAFYPLRIPVSHWQLRHYISTPEAGLLYYASGRDIYCLHTASRKRRLIATLPFEARCTASGYGWVCVGGKDKGHFAAIKLDGASLNAGGEESLRVGPAAPWTSGYDASRSTAMAADSSGGARRATSVQVERIGDQIVNSISIHRICDEAAHLDDIVAVLTNNDKTVRIYSLPAHVETAVIGLSFPINHATLSPDGSMLVAVGDQNEGFFFRRKIRDTPPQIPKPHNRLTSASIDWEDVCHVGLYVNPFTPPGQEPIMGYFTTSWSPNGRLCAVGSESGYITLFDTEILCAQAGKGAIAAIVAGSRPDFVQPHPGAIRSMMFAPDPWDLLIWAEDQGRICIGDLRTGLKSKQVINLEPRDEKIKRVACEEVPLDESEQFAARYMDILEADYMRRLGEMPRDAAAVNFATEYIEARRRQRQQRQEMAGVRAQLARPTLERTSSTNFHDIPQGLTPREEQILETLRTTRQREEARGFGGQPTSINYTTSEMFRDGAIPRSNANEHVNADLDARQRAFFDDPSSMQDSMPELTRTFAASPRPMSSRGGGPPSPFIGLSLGGEPRSGNGNHSRQSPGLARLSDGSRLPRRRTSIVHVPGLSNSSQPPTPGEGRGTVGDSSTANSAFLQSEENPWRIIEEHMSLPRGSLRETLSQSRAAMAESTSPHPSRPQYNTTPSFASLGSGLRTPGSATPDPEPQLGHHSARAFVARQRERINMLRAADDHDILTSTSTTVAPEPLEPSRNQADTRRTLTADPSSSSTTTSGNGNSSSPNSNNGSSNTGNTTPPQSTAAAATSGNRTYDAVTAATIFRRNQMPRVNTFTVPHDGSGLDLGVRTAGLAMSPDGRTLWAACEEGIFEIKINVKGRQFLPCVEVR